MSAGFPPVFHRCGKGCGKVLKTRWKDLPPLPGIPSVSIGSRGGGKAENPDVRALEEYDELYEAILEVM